MTDQIRERGQVGRRMCPRDISINRGRATPRPISEVAVKSQIRRVGDQSKFVTLRVTPRVGGAGEIVIGKCSSSIKIAI
jgi:hypothetical protein